MKKLLLATCALTGLSVTAHAQSLQSGSVGGMPYQMLTAPGGCSAATPCSVVTYLSVMDESASGTTWDLQHDFGPGTSFAAANPHTIVIAPEITQAQSTSVNWGGYDAVTSPQQAQMVAVVQSVEASMGNTVNRARSVVTGGSLGGDGTQAALIAYGPKGTVQPGVFSAGLSFDAATYAAAGNAQDIAALCGVPLVAVHGTADTNQSVPYDQNLASALASCGSFTFIPVQGAGHGTWAGGGQDIYGLGVASGTPLAWLTQQLQVGASATGSQTVPVAQAPVAGSVALPPAAQQSVTTAPSAISAMASPTAQTSTAPPATTSNCTAPTTAPVAGPASGGFHVVNGQIIGPNGQPFIAKGVNMGKTDNIAQMLTSFPGLNFVRLSINDYSSGASLSGIVQTLTAKGIVVMIENHLSSDGTYYGSAVGTVFTGSQLQQELSWYADIARTNARNPYVWTASRNEPPGPGAALAGEIQAIYAAVRGTGNTAPFLIDVMGAYDTTGMPANFAAAMANVGYDLHFYGWIVPGHSAVQSDVDAELKSLVNNLQQFHSADGVPPVIVAEYGDATDGVDMDGNGMQVVAAVLNAGSVLPQYTSGGAAWHVGWMGSPGDSLNNPDGSLTAPYGQAVSVGIGTNPTASPHATFTPTTVACVVQQPNPLGPVILNAGPAPTLPAPTQAAATAATNSLPNLVTSAALIQQAEAAVQANQPTATSDALILQAQAALQAALTAQPAAQ